MRVEYDDGNNLTEEANRYMSGKEAREDYETVIDFDHEIIVPTDDGTGERTETPRHNLVMVYTYLGRSDPLLRDALAQDSS